MPPVKNTAKTRRKGVRGDAVGSALRLRDAENALLISGNDRRAADDLARRYDVPHQTAARWVAKVREMWAKDASESMALYRRDVFQVREEHRGRIRLVFATAMIEKNQKVALEAATRLAQLDGFLSGRALPPGVEMPEASAANPMVEMLRALLAQRGGVDGRGDPA